MTKRKILIIEDDSFISEMYARKLRSLAYQVEQIEDGSRAIEIIKEQKPDLILLDLVLPGADGFKILAMLKKDSELKNIPVLILSNLGQSREVEKGLRLGADDYLIKAHFTPGEVVAKIEGLLRKNE